MQCPQCGTAIGGQIHTCPFCRTLPGIPQTGVLATLSLGRLSDSPLHLVFVLTVLTWNIILFTQGTSDGEWLLGIRIHTTDGDPARFRRVFIRETIWKSVPTPFSLACGTRITADGTTF